MEIIECSQGSEEWFQIRSGIPTASMFNAVMAKGQGKTRRSYMLRLVAESIMGEPVVGYKNADMERGNEMEKFARAAYEFTSGNKVEEVGFIRNNDVGFSPDGFVGDDGIIEIKTKKPELQMDVLLRDEVPTEHLKQIQGGLWVAEREWCDFVSYWNKLPIFIKRVYRDEEYISRISEAVDIFNAEMSELRERMLSM